MAFVIHIEAHYVHASMYEHDAFNQRNTPKTRLNEILYIEKMLLPSLSCLLSPELTSRRNGFPFNWLLIMYSTE